MKNIIILIYLFVCSSWYSQIASVEYLVEKQDLKQKFVLDIRDKKSYFYSNEYCENNHDEIFNFVIIEANQGNNVFLFHDQLEDLRVYFSQPIDLVWQLDKETKTVENVTLYKATTIYKNKKWTAWYNNETPINSGPFVFGKLPGLIYEVATDELKISLTGLSKSNKNCFQILKKEERIDKESYDKYNSDFLKKLKEGYRKNTNVFDGITIEALLEESQKKDLFREYL
ncbi:GLPGLI family protein [Riemerella anatipestifer]|uniref:GLPGLI family protein n=1 Tax=Riemerella anatipestifer TaxID=34085 RepID=UPI0023635898|nr:GLPGLI family protein [Riemerella anatipestifer]MDD1553609.1 GLPGLI family protein [Riemerella anatipestifer]MDY3334768.1 GLPGLI family protein [Riemerella anatipestifer]MDY3381173.1 GLPGLI family protein [Riemerella anatipestifer]MDY3385161.1 GLPGLI family protein [Riemerella anatipestifer]MDY3480997.1 GLPGLI family protein [Riemerella anatipestifer]